MSTKRSFDDEDEDEEYLAALRQREQQRRQQTSTDERLGALGSDAKPVFLTKAQREALSSQEEQEQEEISLLMDEAEKEQRQAYMQKVREALREQREKGGPSRPVALGGSSSGGGAGASSSSREAPKSKEEVDKEKELEAIRNSYLGVKKKKKKVLKISEKFRFSFDWAADEDTSVDLNPIYEKKHEALLLFGRGLRGGIDRREQLQKRDTVLRSRYDEGQKSAPTRPPPSLPPPVMAPPPPNLGYGLAPLGGGAPMPMMAPPPPPPGGMMPPPPPPPGYAGAPPPPPPPDGMMPPPPPPDDEPPPPPPPPEDDASQQTDAERFEERLRIMNSKSWVDKMMNKYDGALHYSKKEYRDMDARDWRIFREDNEIGSKGNMRHPATGKQIMPFRYWQECEGMPDEVLGAIRRAGYERPTGVQMMCIPLGLACKDVIGVAKTGSGKTCAFVLPMLVYVLSQPPITKATAPDGPLALIMAPTRELVQQIEDETKKFAGELKIRVYSVVGGLSIEQQSFMTSQGTEVMVATPGRLNDALDRRYMVLNQCNYVVLDEADRMIDMGFEPQVRAILDAMPSSNLKPAEEDALIDLNAMRYRQTFMFSATMPPQVERIARTYMRQPAIVYIGDQGSSKNNITQVVHMVKENKKKDVLMEMLGGGLAPPIIIFCNGKRGCDVLGKSLDKQGFPTAVIHSGKDQATREQAIDGFKSGEFEILVATDIAGRGIDIEGIEHVINYDMPKDIESYTHRIGRTGRAGRKGTATTLVTGEGIEKEVLHDLKTMLEKCGQKVPNELARHPDCVPADQREFRKKHPKVVEAKK